MAESDNFSLAYSRDILAYIQFHDTFRKLCIEVGQQEKARIDKSIKMTSGFVIEYLPFIKSADLRETFFSKLKSITKEYEDDRVFQNLSNIKAKTVTQLIIFNQKYYFYMIKLYRLIGIYGDELSTNFMPNKSDRERIFKYYNLNPFFESFINYKGSTSYAIANFSLRKFQEGFMSLIGFYFAYYLFIDEQSRYYCEKVISNVVNIILNKDTLNMMILGEANLSQEKKEMLRALDFKIHESISLIFFRCNFCFSQYNVLPKLQKKILIDTTTI